jgi:two-component system, NarL family, sensor histidine kinase DevS
VVTEATDGLGFEPRLQFDGSIEMMDAHIADHLMPVLREALSNIAHHAQSDHVRVAVSVTDDVTVTVSDDGIGVPTEVLGGRGFINLAERARDFGGDFTITPQPSGGSLLHLAGARQTVPPADMTGAPRVPVRRVLLRAG